MRLVPKVGSCLQEVFYGYFLFLLLCQALSLSFVDYGIPPPGWDFGLG